MKSLIRNSWVPTICLAATASLPALQEEKALQPGDVLPGPFQVLMVTGPRAGLFHCPVCEYDINPAVLVFVRDDQEVGPVLNDLLKRLDGAIAKHHAQAHLMGCAIFLNDGGYRQGLEAALDDKTKAAELPLTLAIANKEQKEAKLKDLAGKEGLKNLTLGLARAEGLDKYKLGKTTDVTVLVYVKQKVVANFAFKKGELNDKEVEKILQAVDTMATDVGKQTVRPR